MSGPRVWVDENDLRLLLRMVEVWSGAVTDEMHEARDRIKDQLDPPSPPPLQPYIACMQGHGA